MNTSIINFDYKGNQISFERGKDVLVNLTAMAKPFPDKNLSQIVNSLEIKEYINALTEIQNYSSADLLIVRKGGDISQQGTWAHRLLAIRVAQKLNPALAVWVDMRIEELLTTGVTIVSNEDEAIAYAMQVLNRRLEESRAEKERLQAEKAEVLAQNFELEHTLEESKPKIDWSERNQESKGLHTLTTCLHDTKICTDFMNKIMLRYKVVRKIGNEYSFTVQYQNKGFGEAKPKFYLNKEDVECTTLQLKFTEKGRRLVLQLIDHAEDDGFIYLNKGTKRYSLSKKECGYTVFKFK